MRFQDKVELAGIVTSCEKEYEHEDVKTRLKEVFYRVLLNVPRFSNNYDSVPLVVSGKLLVHTELEPGTYIKVEGSIRTRDYDEKQHHVAVFAYIDDLNVITEEEFKNIENPNRVYLDGTVCRETSPRHTNSGRVITDIILAHNRWFPTRTLRKLKGVSHESYYIPCIAWGPNAKAAAKLHAGDSISITGRFQSREYRRKSDKLNNVHVAYEVSIINYSLINDKESGYREKSTSSDAAVSADKNKTVPLKDKKNQAAKES